jgi:hypothetical protein
VDELLRADGDASILDTSKTLDALLKHSERLTQLIARNTRLGQVLLGYSQSLTGQTAAGSGASGYAIRLGFVTAEALEREMSIVREDKYGLLARMVLRFAQANGLIPTGQTPDVVAVLGKGLPADRAASIVEVTSLLSTHAISTYTAVLMLVDAGLPIEDAQEEVRRIQSERYDVAVGIVEATGNVEAASKYMGVKYEPPPPTEPAATGDTGPPSQPAGSGTPAPPNPQAAPGLHPAAPAVTGTPRAGGFPPPA